MIRVAPHRYQVEASDPSPFPVPKNASFAITVDGKLAQCPTQEASEAIWVSGAKPGSIVSFYTPQKGAKGSKHSIAPQLALEASLTQTKASATCERQAKRPQPEEQNSTQATEAWRGWTKHNFGEVENGRKMPAKNASKAKIESLANNATNAPIALAMEITLNGVTAMVKKALPTWEEGKWESEECEAEWESGNLRVKWNLGSEWATMAREGSWRYRVGWGSILGKLGAPAITVWSEWVEFGVNKAPGKVQELELLQ